MTRFAQPFTSINNQCCSIDIFSWTLK
ncbi:hypothetical protein OIU78_016505 [Salix suchowensis]|nr:hypothetical protein OIU78_016505 [Salix suchowensis]